MGDPSSPSARRAELADRLRRWATWLVQADDEELAHGAGLIEPPPSRSGPSRFARGARSPEGGDRPANGGESAAGLDGHPLHGAGSGVFPPLDFQVVDARSSVLRVRFPPAFEGPPGLVHGGHVAAGFDIGLSQLSHRLIGPSLTRRLQIRYYRGAPLDADLTYTFSAADEPSRRVVAIEGRLHGPEGRLLASALSEFARVSTERFLNLSR